MSLDLKVPNGQLYNFMFSSNCSDCYSVGVKSVFRPCTSAGKLFYIVLNIIGIETKCGFPLSRNFYLRPHVNFTRVSKIEAMYERLRANVKVEPRSTFTFTHGLSYISSILFTRVITCVRAHGKVTRQWKSVEYSPLRAFFLRPIRQISSL